MGKLIITESERLSILSQHGCLTEEDMYDVAITDWLSPDENYVIFLDELYHIPTKQKLGNIWENYETLKVFLTNIFSTPNLSKQIKEDAERILNNKLLTESTQNLSLLKEGFKTMINEGLWDNFKNWVSETGKSSIEGFKEFIKTTKKGISSVVDKISNGEWGEVFSLLKKGVIYLFRKIRSAMYHPIGMILDAILIATGIGLGAQKVIWGIIVALDVYELITGDYEEEMSMIKRILFIGVDILGFVFAGAAAKAARIPIETALGSAKTLEGTGKIVAKNPTIKNLIERMLSGIEKVPSLLNDVKLKLVEKLPKASGFISKVLGGITSVITKIVDTLSSVLKFAIPGETKLAKGARAGVGTGALVGGIGTYGEYGLEILGKQKVQIADKIVSNPNFADSINNNLLKQLNT